MHSDHEIIARAGSVGLVTRREVLDGVVSVRSDRTREHVHAILVGNHPVAYMKERASGSRVDDDTTDDLSRERTALDCISDVDLGPHLLTGQSEDALWIGVVRGVDLVHAQGSVPELAEVCESWGVAVAQLHLLSTVRPGVTSAPRPWLLDPDARARVGARTVRGSARAGIIAAMEEDAKLRSAAAQVSARWTERRWVHGDLTPHNVVVQSAPPMRVRFLDFEGAGLGDPAWDLATVQDSITWLAPRWQTPAAPLIEYFERGYRRAGGPGALYPAMQAVRAVASAWELAGRTRTATGRSDPQDWLQRARLLAARAARQPRLAA